MSLIGSPPGVGPDLTHDREIDRMLSPTCDSSFCRFRADHCDGGRGIRPIHLPDRNSYTCMRRESTWAKRRSVPRLGTRRLPRCGQRNLRQPGRGGRPGERAVARRRAPRAPLLGKAHAPPHHGYCSRSWTCGRRSSSKGSTPSSIPKRCSGSPTAGHELGYHGWRHEYWPDLGRSDEARALERGVHKMQEIGVRPSGFRPSGGG